jgi:hypothetical protein
MPRPSKKQLTDAVDRRTEQLVKEWDEYLESLEARRLARSPGSIPMRPEQVRARWFEHWVMQKLAGLQVIAERHEEGIARLANLRGRGEE